VKSKDETRYGLLNMWSQKTKFNNICPQPITTRIDQRKCNPARNNPKTSPTLFASSFIYITPSLRLIITLESPIDKSDVILYLISGMAETTTKNGLNPNTAAALSYLVGFITGIYFFLTSKDKYVRFHALQSSITSVGFMVLNAVLSTVGLYSLTSLVGLVSLILFIYMIVQAYQGKKFKLPVIGDLAEKNA